MQNAFRGFSYFCCEAAKDPRENAMEQTISVSLVTGLDSLDIMSDTKE